MSNVLLILILLLLLGVLVLQWLLLRKKGSEGGAVQLETQLQSLERGLERTERALRDELARSREEQTAGARQLREELSKSVAAMGDSSIRTMGEIANLQKNQLETFANRLTVTSQNSEQKLELMREALTQQQNRLIESNEKKFEGFATRLSASSAASEQKLDQMREALTQQQNRLIESNEKKFEAFSARLSSSSASSDLKLEQMREGMTAQIARLTESNEKKIESLRTVVDQRLQQLQEDNSKKLDQMRQTVDEKLQGALEKRLGESFKLVSERLEQVHKGLGEMQTLAAGVGDLKKVLSNVKTRGTWGEIQLGNLLEQVLAPEQYEQNVSTRTGSSEVVEFAIRLPGSDDRDGKPVYLPIDAKFPQEDYQRLVDAQDRGDAEAVEAASRQLAVSVRNMGKDICSKYINPPATTDFAIMFLPTEGLYAEVIRRPGLVELVQRECRVIIAGPTTLAALLNSLQMGFRTLAIQKRSSEVWELLAAVKGEFTKYGDVLAKVQKKLQEANNTIDQAHVRTRAIERRLRKVQSLPTTPDPLLLTAADDEADPVPSA